MSGRRAKAGERIARAGGGGQGRTARWERLGGERGRWCGSEGVGESSQRWHRTATVPCIRKRLILFHVCIGHATAVDVPIGSSFTCNLFKCLSLSSRLIHAWEFKSTMVDSEDDADEYDLEFDLLSLTVEGNCSLKRMQKLCKQIVN